MTVPRETQERLACYAALVRQESTRQNLVSASTLATFEQRHIQDSAQLVPLGAHEGRWLDLGSGAGLPGIVLAILGCEVLLVEGRRRRHEFLRHCIDALALDNAQLHPGLLETLPTQRFATITARAFAPLPRLFQLASRFADPATIWVLPKGRSAETELASLDGTWQGDFRTVASVTDPDSRILIARDVRAGTGR